jgi:hypothetical protein
MHPSALNGARRVKVKMGEAYVRVGSKQIVTATACSASTHTHESRHSFRYASTTAAAAAAAAAARRPRHTTSSSSGADRRHPHTRTRCLRDSRPRNFIHYFSLFFCVRRRVLTGETKASFQVLHREAHTAAAAIHAAAESLRQSGVRIPGCCSATQMKTSPVSSLSSVRSNCYSISEAEHSSSHGALHPLMPAQLLVLNGNPTLNQYSHTLPLSH